MSATEGKLGTVRVASLQVTFQVRRDIDADNKRIIRDLYASGRKVEPIMVYRGTTIIHDGRTRRAALLELGWQDREIEVLFVDRPRSVIDQFAAAMSENWGGSAPTKYEDILFVFRRFLSKGVSEGKIRDAFAFIPRKMLRQYLNDARSRNSRASMEAARRLVAAGATIEVAAKQCDVDVGKLREKVAGSGKKHIVTSVGEIKAALSSQSGAHTLKLGNQLKQVFQSCEDEEMSVGDALEVIEHLEELVRRAIPFVQEWKERIVALNGKTLRRPRAIVVRLPKKSKTRAKAKKSQKQAKKAA